MQRTLINETMSFVGQKVTICGFVTAVRTHGKISFIDLRDRSGEIQIVGQGVGDLKPEYTVKINGTIKKRDERYINKKIVTGEIEVEAEGVEVLSKSQDLPFDIHKPELDVSMPVMFDFRNAALRNKKIADIFRLQATIVQTFRELMTQEGFLEIQAPTIVATATEGGAEVFKIDYFDHSAYLAQSPQFYKQMMVSIYERVFTVAHAYRAEPSVTTRHLTEYIGMDAEMGFIDSWLDVLNMADKTVKKIFTDIVTKNGDILAEYGVEIPKTVSETPRMKLKEAQQIIFDRTGRDIRGEPDMDPEGEKEICRYTEEKFGSDLVFITHFPTNKRPWYTYQDPDNPEETLSFDMIGKGVEWITGGQRIHGYDKLVENIKSWGLDPEVFEIPYLQAFKYGMPPEGGFCLGLERITQNILGLASVKMASLYPRDMERIDIRLSSKDTDK